MFVSCVVHVRFDPRQSSLITCYHQRLQTLISGEPDIAPVIVREDRRLRTASGCAHLYDRPACPSGIRSGRVAAASLESRALSQTRYGSEIEDVSASTNSLPTSNSKCIETEAGCDYRAAWSAPLQAISPVPCGGCDSCSVVVQRRAGVPPRSGSSRLPGACPGGTNPGTTGQSCRMPVHRTIGGGSKVDQRAWPEFLAGGGKVGVLMRRHDWTRTSLGPVENWPQALRSAIGICLNTRFPIAIYWGPELALLYNDPWSPIPGAKHPWALGRPAREVWPEIWDTIGPMFEGVAASGEGTYSEDQLLPMHRRGFTEECY